MGITDGLNIILTTFKMKLLILIVGMGALYFTKDVKSFGIRQNGLSEETKNFGRGPVQTLEAMLERDLGPLDILERYERSPIAKKGGKKHGKGKKHSCEEESMESEESEEEPGKGSKEGKKHSKKMCKKSEEEPEEPEEPEDPEDSEDPEDPEDPENPEDPEDPEYPEDPEEK